MTTPALVNPVLRSPAQAAHDVARSRRLRGDTEGIARIMKFLRGAAQAQARDADSGKSEQS